jgi:uncharacterized protein DUF1565
MAVGTQRCFADTISWIAGCTPSVRRVTFLLPLVTACGFPRPPDVGDDAPGDSGTPVDPAAVVHVSPSGDDTNDGHTQPVKTIKHAIDIAAGDPKVVQIALAAGRYSATSGEAFPYDLPRNVTLVGPLAGGAVLSGGKMTPALNIAAGSLQDLDLQDFTTAIIATGAVHVQNVKIETSAVAIQAETTSVLAVDDLTISGTLGACGSGIVLNGGASLMAKTLETHNLQSTLDMRDQSSADISNATISGDLNCSGVGQSISVTSTASFRLTDSTLDGGRGGIGITPKSPNFQAVLTNTSIRNMKDGAIGGGFGGVSAPFHMFGGDISNTNAGATAVSIGPGVWTFTGVTFSQNKGLGFYLQDGSLVMRGCTMTGSGGIDVFVDSTADLGTIDSPGNNVFQNNGVSVVVESNIGVGGIAVQAVGNIWNPKVQNADDNGKYATVETISGPLTAPPNGNYSVNDGCKLLR